MNAKTEVQKLIKCQAKLGLEKRSESEDFDALSSEQRVERVLVFHEKELSEFGTLTFEQVAAVKVFPEGSNPIAAFRTLKNVAHRLLNPKTRKQTKPRDDGFKSNRTFKASSVLSYR